LTHHRKETLSRKGFPACYDNVYITAWKIWLMKRSYEIRSTKTLSLAETIIPEFPPVLSRRRYRYCR
jgi:hypothetical protein